MAIYNGGGIRSSIPAGPIKQGDLVTVSPFGNWAMVKRVNASARRAALANGVSQWATVGPAGRFPQVGLEKRQLAACMAAASTRPACS